MADAETELMLRVKAGDRAAFQLLFFAFQRPVLNYLYRLSRNVPLSEDLTQETFLRLWKAASTYEPTAKVSTYVFRIAHNLYLNESARRREKAWDGAEETAEHDPSADLQRRELQSAVQRAIESLPDGEREVILLSEFQGFKYAEIGEVLGIPVGTVKSRMFSAVQRLKKVLGPRSPTE